VVLPLIAKILASTVSIVISMGVLVGIYVLLTSPKVATFYRVFCYNVAGWIVTVDPIGIARDRILQMQKALLKMEGYLKQILGKKSGLDKQMAENEKQRLKQIQIRDMALKQNMQKDARLAAEQIARLVEANKTLSELAKNVELLYRRLDQMHEVADFQIKNTIADVDVREQTWNLIKDANSAMKSAMSVLEGNPDERALFEQSMQAMADEIDAKTGEMQLWINKSEQLVNSNNLQRDILADAGFKELANTNSLLLSEQQVKQIVVQTEDHNDVLDTSKPTRTSQYSAYLRQ
jgi:hypothetical protein